MISFHSYLSRNIAADILAQTWRMDRNWMDGTIIWIWRDNVNTFHHNSLQQQKKQTLKKINHLTTTSLQNHHSTNLWQFQQTDIITTSEAKSFYIPFYSGSYLYFLLQWFLQNPLDHDPRIVKYDNRWFLALPHHAQQGWTSPSQFLETNISFWVIGLLRPAVLQLWSRGNHFHTVTLSAQIQDRKDAANQHITVSHWVYNLKGHWPKHPH